MQYIKGNIYHGFKLVHEEDINEIKSTARVFEHLKSGARLIQLSNEDDDKLFSIGFRTTPTDSTGVAHILEHSVLCGSKKFKTKDPFADMAKSSLNTFMNAMTYTDKTIYPVGSRNDKDFMNLMDVYLDAVLHPRIYENRNILKQEGWRYELDEDNKLTYKGIVYSEMKGALSSPEETIINKIYKSLFPNTTYENVSGGDPEVIPELTQKGFENFHSKFYHPSNSYIYLYGNENLDECLRFIDEEYLSEFDRIEIPSSIGYAKPFSEMVKLVDTYSIDNNDNNKTFLSLNFAYENTSDALAYLTHKVLYNMLIESPASPIKRALLDAKIGESLVTGEDMNMDPTKELLMPIVVKNAVKGQEEKFKNVILETLKELVDKGINEDLLNASINTIEFRLREIVPYKSLSYNELILESWLYDGEPLALLKFDKVLEKLKANVNSGYFEEFIKRNMIENKHSSLVVLNPEKGLAAKKAKLLEEKLEKYKNSLSEVELKNIIDESEILKKEQSKKDSEEEKDSIPKLNLSEIDRKVEVIPQKVIKEKNMIILEHDIFTGKIEYMNLLFDISNVDEEDIPYLGLLTELLGKLDTNKQDYSTLVTRVAKVTGGINFDTLVCMPENNYNRYIPKLRISSKAVVNNIKETLELINEIITNTKFDNTDRIHEIIKETRANLELNLLDNGHEIAIEKVCSMINLGSVYKEKLNGESYFSFICKLDKNYKICKEEVITKLNLIYNKVFNVNNLIISLVGEEQDNEIAIENINLAIKNVKYEVIDSNYISETTKSEVCGICTGSNVQYVVKGYNTSKLGYNYSGKMIVMTNILDSDYLFTKVRLQGGAYGCYTFINRSGNLGVWSYRDPNLKSTLDVYDEAYRFLENLELSKRDMEDFIIGTIGMTYKPLTPNKKGERAALNYICGITNEDNQKIKDEILSTTVDDIRGYADMIRKVMDKNYCCVVGNKENIIKNKSLFDDIKNI